MITIASLIYKSKRFADSVWNSAYEHTPMLRTGEAKFLFVANSPTIELLRHLDFMGYNFVLHENGPFKPEEVPGLAPPFYIRYVYKGWNRAIDECQDICVLVNSDHVFSPDWLENLLKHLDDKTLVSSTMVERKHPKYEIFPGAFHAELGSHPDNFQKQEFLDLVQVIKENVKGEGNTFQVKSGGAYMPVAFVKKDWRYPEGNFFDSSGTVRYGDELLFQALADNAYRHITALDSIVYHFKEGEQDEVLDSDCNKEPCSLSS